MKGTVFLEPGSSAAKHLRARIDGTSDDGLPFLECKHIEYRGPYLLCTPERQPGPNSWLEITLSEKNVAFIVKE